MYGRTLSWGLHWGRRVQTQLVERACADVGEEYQHDQLKRGKISPGELRRSGTCNPIRMDFIQRVTWDTGDSFAGLEKIIYETFLPRLFFRNTKSLSPVLGDLSTIPVKKSGLGLLNPVTSSQENPKLHARGSRAGTGRDRRGVILQCQPPPDPKLGAT